MFKKSTNRSNLNLITFCRNFPILARFQVKKNSFLIQNSTLFQKVVYLINSKNQSIHSSCVKLMICCGNLPVLARFCSRVKQNSRDVGRSKNFGEGVVIGRHNLPPSWDRVNWYAKIWGMRAPPLPPIPTALNRTVTSINAPRALTFEVLQKWKWTWALASTLATIFFVAKVCA
jgi:hypothetical protein